MKKSLLFLLISTLTFAQNIEFSGYGATGFRFFDRNRLNNPNQETYYEGKLQAEFNLKKGFEAQLDFRGNSVDKSVELREFSAKYKSDSWYNIKIGHIKRPFGYEYLINREKLWTIDRSIVQEKISQLGYGSRSVAVMAYYEFDKVKPEIPWSWYLSVSKDNSSGSAITGRVSYYFNDDLAVSGNYMYQAIGGDVPVKVSGFAADLAYRTKKFDANIEAVFVQDPVEGRIRKLAGRDDDVFALGIKTMLARKFEIDESFLEDIEPVIIAGYFVPEADISNRHIIQGVLGSNFYIDKNIKIRLNADMRFTKTEFSENYSTKESRVVFEFQVIF